LETQCISNVPLVERSAGLVRFTCTVADPHDVGISLRPDGFVGSRETECVIQVDRWIVVTFCAIECLRAGLQV
jgi:hypothetical protein